MNQSNYEELHVQIERLRIFKDIKKMLEERQVESDAERIALERTLHTRMDSVWRQIRDTENQVEDLLKQILFKDKMAIRIPKDIFEIVKRFWPDWADDIYMHECHIYSKPLIDFKIKFNLIDELQQSILGA